MSAINYLRYISKLVHKQSADPLYLVHFVTENCNACCKHCLLGNRPFRSDELTLDEISRISESMNRILFLLIAGGEPFLRNDLTEIVDIYCTNNKVCSIGIPTNGMLTDKIVHSVQYILKCWPRVDIGVDVSLDGIGEDHDRIRGAPGLFKKAIQTYRQLEKLTRFFPNFNLNVAVTVSAFNQNRLSVLYDYLLNELHVKTINVLLVRGKPRDQGARDIDINCYSMFNRLLRTDIERGTLKGYHGYILSDFINAMKVVREQVIERIIRQQRCILPCYAGVLSAVIYSSGDVFPCELLNSRMGNVREQQYDFRRIWNSDTTSKIRQYIQKQHCFCTYECFLTNSILFSKRTLPYVLWEWSRIKLGRLTSRFVPRTC
jgi:MoaA/NifB/PqqE/SkfB family radical SAM enzyme